MINSGEEYFEQLIQKQKTKGLKMEGRITIPIEHLRLTILDVWDCAVRKTKDSDSDNLFNGLFGITK